MATSTVVVRLVANDEERDACYRVRETVFVEEQGVPPWEELDAYDETADHFLAEVDGAVVGTARLIAKEGFAKIGRVAVLKEHRGKGIGRDLMILTMKAGFARFPRLVLEAQVQVISFYEQLGFIAEGDVYLDAGIEHRLMTNGQPSTVSPAKGS